MLNTEIGTYQIAQALDIRAKAFVVLDARTITMKINEIVRVGNREIIQQLFPKAVLVDGELKDNKRVRMLTPVQVLDEVYGVKKDSDWDEIYNKTETWIAASKQANKVAKKHVKSSFKLESDLTL